MLDVVERLANVLGVVDSERDELVETVELRDELRPEKGRELLDGESAVAVGGAAGVDEATNYVLVNGLELAQVELTKSGCAQAQKDEGGFERHGTNSLVPLLADDKMDCRTGSAFGG